MQLPETIFGIPLTTAEEPAASRLPRIFTEEFRFLRASLAGREDREFDVVASDRRIDVKKAAAAAEAVSSITGLDAAVCSPALDWWQMRALAERGVPFIRDERNLWMPFLGAAVKMDVSATAPRPLSPQAQRVFTNLLCGAWDGRDAGEIAQLAGKSPSSVSKYLAELSAVCPQLIEKVGRRRLLTSAGIGKDELLERFDGYLSSPVARSCLLKQRIAGRFFCCRMMRNRSTRARLGTGWVMANKSSAWSTFATFGRIRSFRRGRSFTTFPSGGEDTVSVTSIRQSSPTRGFSPRARNTPFALQR